MVGKGAKMGLSGTSGTGLRRQVARLEKMVAQVRPETKYVDSSLTSTNIPSTTGTAILLTSITQGVVVAGRIGNFVRVVSVEVHTLINYTSSIAAAINEHPSYRVYVVIDTTQVGDTAPTLADLVDQPSLPLTQLRNVNEQKRFRILYDSGPQLVFTGLVGAGMPNSQAIEPCKLHLHFHKKNLNLEVIYNGVNGSDIQRNGVYLMVSTNMAGGAGSAVLDMEGAARVGYTDA